MSGSVAVRCHVILNRGASIGHDTVVGDYVTVGGVVKEGVEGR